MSDFLQELDEDFKDDPDYQALSRAEKVRIVRVLEKMMEMVSAPSTAMKMTMTM